MALRDVPRSIPTWRTSFFPLMSTPSGGRMVPRLRVREDSVRKGLCDLLTIPGILEMTRLFVVRHGRDLREDARHLRGDEDDERRAPHAAVLEPGHDGPERGHEAALHGLGELPGLALARVGHDALQKAAKVGHRVARGAVLVSRELLDVRVRRGAEKIRLDATLVLHRGERVHVNRDEEVGLPRVREDHAVLQRQGRIRLARERHGDLLGDEQVAEAARPSSRKSEGSRPFGALMTVADAASAAGGAETTRTSVRSPRPVVRALMERNRASGTTMKTDVRKRARRTRSERRRPLGSRPSMTSTFSRIASLRIDCRSRFSLAMELRKRVAPADLLPMMRARITSGSS